MTTVLAVLVGVALWLVGASPCRAQLASNFYNLTKIETRALPNAVEVTVRCDGTPTFGSEFADWIDFSEGFRPKQTARVRLRFLRARSLLPAFNNIGIYPVDAAVSFPGQDDFSNPYFENFEGYGEVNARVDVELRFAVPILVRRFQPSDGYGVRFGDYVGPREISVRRGADNTSVVVTVFTDRADTRAAEALKRSPKERQTQRLSVRLLANAAAIVPPAEADPPPTPPEGRGESAASDGRDSPLPSGGVGGGLPATPFRFDALHSTLGSALQAVSDSTGAPLLAAPESSNDDLTLLLPRTTVTDFLNALQAGSGYAATPLVDPNGATVGFLVGRGGDVAQTVRLPLRFLRPETARLLFPDFLLPFLRADPETNALIVSAPPAIVERVRRDLEQLDAARAQVRVTVQTFELTQRDLKLASLVIGNVGGTTGINTDLSNGAFGLTLARGQAQSLRVQLGLLQERGVARLRSQSSVTVLVGEVGNLFLGQNRFVQVLRSRSGGQNAEVEQLEVGLSLRARPIASAPEGITLEISPRVSTVDAIEAATRLPTLGVREAQSTVRLREGEAALVAGLESDLNERARRALGLSGERSRERSTLLLLVSASRA